ncbi:MAG: DUF4430 domain-containing protein [Pirellulales bacterium]
MAKSAGGYLLGVKSSILTGMFYGRSYPCQRCGAMLVVWAAVLGLGCSDHPAGKPTAAAVAEATVAVIVDRGDDKAIADAEIVGWSQGMTALDALEALKSRGLETRTRGSGPTAFVEAIDGFENSAANKNWIYFVNDNKATAGAGVFVLKPDDVVLWKYTDEVE